MTHEPETLFPEPERTPAAYRRDLYRDLPGIGQLRDDGCFGPLGLARLQEAGGASSFRLEVRSVRHIGDCNAITL